MGENRRSDGKREAESIVPNATVSHRCSYAIETNRPFEQLEDDDRFGVITSEDDAQTAVPVERVGDLDEGTVREDVLETEPTDPSGLNWDTKPLG